MWYQTISAAIVLSILIEPANADDPHPLGLRLPAGFQATEFSGPALANDIISIALDSRHRITASGRGYVRILPDDDGDGRADRAIDFAHGPADGAQGMLWDPSGLLVTGDGGLRRYQDADADDVADQPSELLLPLKTGGEHDAHDIKRGPDGWLYLLCGNMTGIDSRFATTARSPVRQPVAGCIIRLSPDYRQSEIVAHGFRNAYRMDFSPTGELFTYDSDNERCVSLPWYEPTRFYHVVWGGHHGWLSPQRGQFWRLPPYMMDVVEPAAYLGRGSPTGVVCYRHQQFPGEYYGGFFLADWTFGRVYFVPITARGSTFTGAPRVFLESVGDNGFAPTDLAVDPVSGDLLVSIGGRGTRGAIYRIRYTGRASEPARAERESPAAAPLLSIQSQQLLNRAAHGDIRTRLKAIQHLARQPSPIGQSDILTIVVAGLNETDRQLRWAVSELIGRLEPGQVVRLGSQASTARSLALVAMGAARQKASSAGPIAVAAIERGAVERDRQAQLDAIRAIQLALGDMSAPEFAGTVFEGYTARLDPSLAQAAIPRELHRSVQKIAQYFPTGDPDLDRELARTAALVQDDSSELLHAIAERLTGESSPQDDVHTLAVLARLTADRTPAITARTVQALLALDKKCQDRALNRDRNWSLRVGELHGALAARDPMLNDGMAASADFGRPDHVIYTMVPGFDRQRAAQQFAARAKAEPDFAWNARIVELLGELPESEYAPWLRQLWDHQALRETIVRVLARMPSESDRSKFITGLGSAQLDAVDASLTALEKLENYMDPSALLAAINTMRRLSNGKQETAVRLRAGKLVQAWTGQSIAATDAAAWTRWFEANYPELASQGPNGINLADWRLRLESIDWSAGNPERGRHLFARAACLACHSGPRAIGPDLHGATSRFSTDDLFLAILQPARDVSPRYQTTLVATNDGKTYEGMVIYDAVDSLILQTGADTTVRIDASQIDQRRVTSNSIMPAGLLNELNDAEIADLLAYLKTLR